MRICLANGPWSFCAGHYAVRAGSRWPHFNRGSVSRGGYIPYPFYLGYATSLLNQDGHQTLAIDALAEELTEDDFHRRIKAFSPELVLLEIATPSLHQDLRTASRIGREIPGVKIAFSGLHIDLGSSLFLDQNPIIDFALYGEYEYTLRELAQCIAADNNLTAVAGVAFRKHDGTVQVNPPRPLIENLDELPWPERDQLPILRYNDAPFLPTPVLMMWASRGCPFGCTFCCWPQIMYRSRKYRARSMDDVVEEMLHITAKFGFNSVYFDDDTFNIGNGRMQQFAELLRRRSFSLPWGMMARVDTITKETLRKLRDSGLTMVKYGVESADQNLVNAANKNLSVRKVKEMVCYTKSLGIFVHLTFTFGLPGETWESIKRTIDFALQSGVDSVQFSVNTPYPGTEYFCKALAEGHISYENWNDFAAEKAVVRTDNLTAQELRKAVELAYTAWHTRTNGGFKLNRRLTPRRLFRALSNPRETLQLAKKYYHSLRDLRELNG